MKGYLVIRPDCRSESVSLIFNIEYRCQTFVYIVVLKYIAHTFMITIFNLSLSLRNSKSDYFDFILFDRWLK